MSVVTHAGDVSGSYGAIPRDRPYNRPTAHQQTGIWILDGIAAVNAAVEGFWKGLSDTSHTSQREYVRIEEDEIVSEDESTPSVSGRSTPSESGDEEVGYFPIGPIETVQAPQAFSVRIEDGVIVILNSPVVAPSSSIPESDEGLDLSESELESASPVSGSEEGFDLSQSYQRSASSLSTPSPVSALASSSVESSDNESERGASGPAFDAVETVTVVEEPGEDGYEEIQDL